MSRADGGISAAEITLGLDLEARPSAVEALAELTRLGAGGADLHSVATLVVEDARKLIGCDLAALIEVKPDQTFTAAAVVGHHTDTWSAPRPIQADGPFVRSMSSGRAVIRYVSDINAPRHVRLFSRDEGLMTTICAPLVACPGVLYLGWIERIEPTPAQLSMAETLASYAGTIVETARARQAEAERNAQLMAVVKHMPSGVLLTDRNGVPILVNDAMHHIIRNGATTDRPVFEAGLANTVGSMRSAISGKALEAHELPTPRALAGEQNVRDIILLRRPGETEDTCLMVSSTALRDPSGEISGAVTVMTDVTRETLLQRQVKAYADQLQRVYDSMACGVMVVSRSGPLYGNRAARDMLGLPHDAPVLAYKDEIGSLFREDGTPLPEVERPGRRVLLTGVAVHGQVIGHQLPDGRMMWTQEDAVPVFDEDGNVELAVVSFVDVSERKQTREALEDQFTFLQATMASLGEGLYASDESGRLVLMNRAAEDILGWTQAELQGRPAHEAFHHSRSDGTGLSSAECGVMRARTQSTTVSVDDEVFVRRDGTIIPVSYTASPVTSQGKPSGVVVAFRDVSEQKEAEAALRASEDRYRDLVDHSWDIICTHDLDGTVLFVNQAAADIVGAPIEQLIGGSIRDRLAPEVRDGFEQYIAEIVSTGSSGGVMRVLTRRGERRLWEYRNSLRTDGVPRPVVRAMARDVTETYRTERELRRSEARFRALIEDSSELIALTDADGIFQYVSPAIRRLLGYEPAALEGSNFADLVHRDDLVNLRETLAALLAEPGNRMQVSYRARHRNGSWRYLRGVATNLLDDPAVGAVVGNVWDVTEALEAQHALEESEERYRIIVETAFEGVWVVDPDGRTEFANEQMATMLGCRLDELRRSSVFDFLDDELKPAFEARGRRRQAGLSERYEGRFRRKDGSEIWALVSASPLRSNDGEITGALAMMTDITERKSLELIRRQTAELEAENERIAHSSELRARFFATISHELRSPLNAIIGMAELLEQGSFGPLTSRQREMAGRLLGSSEHLLKLVNGVLDLAKIEAGKLDFDPEPVSLRDIVDEAIATLTPAADERQVRIERVIDDHLDLAFLDATRLRQVLYNYISNAIKFSPPESSIAVRLLATDDLNFRIEVEDHGIGIAPNDLDKLFREFEQLPNSGRGKDKGTGLGLAITKRIVEAQGGEVRATSSPGHGSVFSAVLPLRQAPKSLGAPRL